MTTESFHDFLGRVAMFKEFTAQEIDELLRITNRVRFKPEQVICRAGEDGDCMYIIREGIIKVMARNERGADFILARLSEGEVVGEMSLVDDAPRSATLVAETDAVLYEIYRADFSDLKDEMNPSAYKLLREIAKSSCHRLREVNVQIHHYMDNPAKLFEPEVKSGIESTTVTDRAKRFLKLFGQRLGGFGKEGSHAN